MKENKPTGIVTSTPKISEVDKKKIKDALENSAKIIKTHWLSVGENTKLIKVG